jgi:hypothetical protein
MMLFKHSCPTKPSPLTGAFYCLKFVDKAKGSVYYLPGKQEGKIMKYTMMGEVEHEVVVTRVGKRWGVRVLVNGETNQEMRVCLKVDIGQAVREMLRWEDKCGNWSDMASKSRDRLNSKPAQSYVGKTTVIPPHQFRI